MASMTITSGAITMARAAPVKSGNGVASFGVRGVSKAPSRKSMQVKCMQVWPIGEEHMKFETLSYLPPLTQEQLVKQVEYLIRSNWIPCLEFSKIGFVFRENDRSPGYYDGRYWTLWKLPMFGCTDAFQVIKEIEECKAAYPDAYVRMLGFDNIRQVQCVSFIVQKPPTPAK